MVFTNPNNFGNPVYHSTLVKTRKYMEKKVKDIATFNLAILATMGNYQSLVWRNDNKWKDEKEKLDKEIRPLG